MRPVSFQRYRVRLVEQATYEIVVDARDSDTAEELALAQFEADMDRFKHVDGSFEVIECEEVRS